MYDKSERATSVSEPKCLGRHVLYSILPRYVESHTYIHVFPENRRPEPFREPVGMAGEVPSFGPLESISQITNTIHITTSPYSIFIFLACLSVQRACSGRVVSCRPIDWPQMAGPHPGRRGERWAKVIHPCPSEPIPPPLHIPSLLPSSLPNPSIALRQGHVSEAVLS